MSRWRPSFDEEYRERLEDFLDNNPDLPFDSPRDLMRYCTDHFITDTVRVSEADKMLEEMMKEHG